MVGVMSGHDKISLHKGSPIPLQVRSNSNVSKEEEVY